jgi:hypothetical protein
MPSVVRPCLSYSMRLQVVLHPQTKTANRSLCLQEKSSISLNATTQLQADSSFATVRLDVPCHYKPHTSHHGLSRSVCQLLH